MVDISEKVAPSSPPSTEGMFEMTGARINGVVCGTTVTDVAFLVSMASTIELCIERFIFTKLSFTWFEVILTALVDVRVPIELVPGLEVEVALTVLVLAVFVLVLAVLVLVLAVLVLVLAVLILVLAVLVLVVLVIVVLVLVEGEVETELKLDVVSPGTDVACGNGILLPLSITTIGLSSGDKSSKIARWNCPLTCSTSTFVSVNPLIS
jgi:hypothetical protein